MDLPLLEELEKEERFFKRFKFSGTDDVQVAGNLKTGYTVNVRRVGEEGAAEPEPGACCLDDGTCEVVTLGQCLLDGGVFQGGGTVCEDFDCTQGACCHTDGSCTIETEEDCDGEYQGNGTVCDPNPCPPPPTGACCVGEDCSIETEEDCTGMGGTYQGDDTTCDPNPCEEPPTQCCDEPFTGFLGIGLYMVMTDHTVRTAHTEQTEFADGCDLSTDITTVTTLTRNEDGTCSSVVTCSGTSTYDSIAHPDLEFAHCSWVSDGFGGCTFVLDDGAGGIPCNAACFPGCSCTPSTVSDTEQTCTDDFAPGTGENYCHLERTITLSDPCTVE